MNRRPLPSFASAVPVGLFSVLSFVAALALVFAHPIGSAALNWPAGMTNAACRHVSDAAGVYVQLPSVHDPVAIQYHACIRISVDAEACGPAMLTALSLFGPAGGVTLDTVVESSHATTATIMSPVDAAGRPFVNAHEAFADVIDWTVALVTCGGETVLLAPTGTATYPPAPPF